MKTKIKEVQDYFKGKILNGEFETVEQSQHQFKVKIDKEYYFVIWIGNSYKYPDTVKISDVSHSFMNISFTDEESIKLHNLLKDRIQKYRSETLIKEKEAELKKLKEELK